MQQNLSESLLKLLKMFMINDRKSIHYQYNYNDVLRERTNCHRKQVSGIQV